MTIIFEHQSLGISFSEWISLFTLCLAPLVAHVFSGAPQPHYLTRVRPKWHERIGHYNPTSILWRYIAIADRRIRALSWTAGDTAASNALFWTDDGWDGSESMAVRCIPYATHLPESGIIQMFSGEMVKTAIISLQGAQAIYRIIISNIPDPDGRYVIQTQVALDTVFIPIAVLGLVRLVAAPFLTDDFNFMLQDGIQLHLMPYDSAPQISEKGQILENIGPANQYSTTTKFRQGFLWPSMILKMTCLALITVLCAVSLLVLVKQLSGSDVATGFAYNFFYLVLLVPSILIYIYYFLRGYTTTILPCILFTWYKFYTVFVMVSILIVTIVTALETRRTPCGVYTAGPLWQDSIVCGTHIYKFSPANGTSSGLIGTMRGSKFNLVQFQGICLGTGSSEPSWENQTCNVVSELS